MNITDVGPCKKHLKITIPRDEIDRQYEESLETLRKEAVVPGFAWAGPRGNWLSSDSRSRCPTRSSRVCLMSSLEQIDQDYKLEPITQPQLDVGAIEIPEKGPMNFEMDVEVRPQFEIPITAVSRSSGPSPRLTDKHVDEQLTRFLEGHGHIVPKLEGAAEFGDYLTANVAFVRPDGQPLNDFKEIQFRLQPEIRFQDGAIADTSPLLGASPGDTREVEAKLGTAVVDPDLRGTTLTVRCQVIDLKRLQTSRFESGISRHDQCRRAWKLSARPCARLLNVASGPNSVRR